MRHFWMVMFIIISCIILAGAGVAGVLFYYVHFDEPSPGAFINNSDGGYCNTSQDRYVRPNFDFIMSILENEEMIKDLPDDGSITLAFYHTHGSCKIYDKIYYLKSTEIEEKNIKGDIDIILPSEYGKKLSSGNICEIIQEARANQDLQTAFNLNKAQLVWKYSGMMKYKDCLGL